MTFKERDVVAVHVIGSIVQCWWGSEYMMKLQKMMRGDEFTEIDASVQFDPERAAKLAYKIADAMLKEGEVK